MSSRPLAPNAARRMANKLFDELGRADRQRLENLLALLTNGDGDGRMRLGSALTELFPEQERTRALAAFRQFRSRLRNAAREAGVAVELKVDTQTRTAPEQRVCWFEGEDGATQAATRFGHEEAGEVMRVDQGGVELRDGKPVVRYFVSYAHAGDKLKQDLMSRLAIRLQGAKDYFFECWNDRDLIVGEDWDQQIQTAIDQCDLGLLLVSPDFFVSDYISKSELPQFVSAQQSDPEPGKRAVPVALSKLDLSGKTDLKGLERVQIFHDSAGRAFQECTGNNNKDAFAHELFLQIIRIVDKYFPSPSQPTPSTPSPNTREQRDRLARRSLETYFDAGSFVRTKGVSRSLDKLEHPEKRQPHPGERRDALDFLSEWVV